MKANEMQVGGNHYKTAYEHWDVCIKLGMGFPYLSCTATKYIARWRKKDGLKDLQKALHYINKLLEIAPEDLEHEEDIVGIAEEIAIFSKANSLTDEESAVILQLMSYENRADILVAREALVTIIDRVKAAGNKPVPAEDSNKHADRSEIQIDDKTGW